MKNKDNSNISEINFDDFIIEDVTFFLHPKEGGRYGYYLDVNEKDYKQLAKILSKNNIKFEIQKKSPPF